jgi:hypothetical protein
MQLRPSPALTAPPYRNVRLLAQPRPPLQSLHLLPHPRLGRAPAVFDVLQLAVRLPLQRGELELGGLQVAAALLFSGRAGGLLSGSLGLRVRRARGVCWLRKGRLSFLQVQATAICRLGSSNAR